MTVAIIDYGSGNLRSAAKALERAAGEAGAAETVAVTADPKVVAAADRIVLPGVGAFRHCMAGLSGIPGMIDALDAAVRGAGRPFLGICVGMQLMATRGREHGDHRGLGWVAGDVVRMTPADPALKIPHMGWNALMPNAAGVAHPLLAGIDHGTDVYFVHSYALVGNATDVIAATDHGGPVVAAVARENMAGTQFHPEKSQAAGLRLLANFLKWRP